MTTRIEATRSTSSYAKGLALGLPAIMLGLQLSGWIGFVSIVRDGHADFRNLYTAGYMVRSGHGRELYNYDTQKIFQDALVSREQVAIPFLRPAYQTLVFVPFSFLPFRWAYIAFLTTNLVILALCFRLLRPRMKHLAELWPGLPAGMFLFIPIGAALMQGQDSIILLALLLYALVSIERGDELRAGAMVGLGLFKFQLVIPIALLFLAWRRWRFAVGFALSAIAAGIVSVFVAGPEQSETYIRSILNISVSRSLASGMPLPANMMANLHGLVFGIFGDTSFSVPLVIGISAIILVAAALMRPPASEALGTAIAVSTVVSYYLFVHDLSVLLIPIVLTLDAFPDFQMSVDRLGHMKALMATVVYAAPACMAFLSHDFYIVAVPVLLFAVVIMLPRGPTAAPQHTRV